MTYTRKTRDEYNVEGNYSGWETVTTEDTYREARDRLREYNENEREYVHRIRHRLVRIQP